MFWFVARFRPCASRWPRARWTWCIRSVRYRGPRARRYKLQAYSSAGQQREFSMRSHRLERGRSRIVEKCEARRPRWSCARWTARTALRRRLPSSCRSATATSTRATSSNTRCRRRWSIATDAPRADDCSARPRSWTSIFPIAIISRLVLLDGCEDQAVSRRGQHLAPDTIPRAYVKIRGTWSARFGDASRGIQWSFLIMRIGSRNERERGTEE